MAEREVYLCGPTAMINVLQPELHRAGVPRRHLHIERFALCKKKHVPHRKTAHHPRRRLRSSPSQPPTPGAPPTPKQPPPPGRRSSPPPRPSPAPPSNATAGDNSSIRDQSQKNSHHHRHQQAKPRSRSLAIDYPVYPEATFRSVYINDQALPLLIEEALETQSTKIETISGATNITDSFKQSLQAAILQAKKRQHAVAELPGIRRVEQIMGMPIVVDVRDDEVDEALLDELFDWFRGSTRRSAPTRTTARSAA